MVKGQSRTCCTPDKPCINHRLNKKVVDDEEKPKPTGRVVLMDPSRMPLENPLHDAGRNARYTDSNAALQKVDLMALAMQNADKQADEDADFEALVREKIEQGKVKRGGSWMVAKFQLEKDKRFKVVKRRAEQLYKDITRKMTNEEEPEKPNESGDREEEQPAKRARVDAPAEEDDGGVTFDPDDYE